MPGRAATKVFQTVGFAVGWITRGISFSGNTWTTNDSTQDVFLIHNSRGVTINDTINGGLAGVRVTGSETRDVLISGVLQNQQQQGVTFEASLGAEVSGIVENVLIVGSSTSAANYTAIQSVNGVTIRNSHLSVPQGRAGVFLFESGNPGAGTVIERNFILSGASVPSVEIAAGVTGQTVRDNFIQRSVADANVSGNLISRNTRIE